MILVAKHRAVTLQGFTQDIRDARDIMDGDQHNQLRTFRNAIWLLHLEVYADNEKMIAKPGGQLNHGKSVSVANERSLAPFVPENFLLPKKIQYERCKHRVKTCQGWKSITTEYSSRAGGRHIRLS